MTFFRPESNEKTFNTSKKFSWSTIPGYKMIAASTQYKIGPYVFGLEWLHDTVTTGAANTEVSGDQISASVWYKF